MNGKEGGEPKELERGNGGDEIGKEK